IQPKTQFGARFDPLEAVAAVPTRLPASCVGRAPWQSLREVDIDHRDRIRAWPRDQTSLDGRRTIIEDGGAEEAVGWRISRNLTAMERDGPRRYGRHVAEPVFDVRGSGPRYRYID